MTRIIILLITINLVSCISKDPSTENVVQQRKTLIVDSTLYHCIPEKDTIFDENNFIKYVVIDTFYSVKVKLSGMDTLLSYRFNCSVPKGLVPSFHAFFPSKLCLIRGSGFDYKEFVLAHLVNNQIRLKTFETALAIDLENNFVVYRPYEKQELVVLENILSGKQRKYDLPLQYKQALILKAKIENGHIKLFFPDDKMVEYRFKHTEI